MKYAFVIDQLGCGGAERVLTELANLNSKMNKTHIIVFSKTKSFYNISDDVEVHHIVSKKKYSILRYFDLIKKLYKFYKKEKIDYSISFLPMSNFINAFATIFLKTKSICSERNDPHQEPKSNLLKILRIFAYFFANGIVFQTNDAKKYFRNLVKNKSQVIHNPIKASLKTINSYYDENVIFSVGRLVPQKNPEMLIKAFYEFNKRVGSTYKLHLFGEGILRERLVSLVEQLGISENVIFRGNDQNWHESVSHYKFFVMTSNFEGMPNALLEAMGLGHVCIATDCPIGGSAELIKNGENGYLISVDNIDELVDSLVLLDERSEELDQIRSEARKVNETKSVDKILASWREFCEKC